MGKETVINVYPLIFFFQAEDGIRDRSPSRGLGDVYKRQTLVSTNRVPIRVGGQVKGVVATFQDIKTLQTAERNIRIKLHEKGLVAKYRFSDILGQSPAILEAKHLSENFADSQFTVMLYGETGTGKEMFAQSIHNASPRRDGPFVAINCTALNRNLLNPSCLAMRTAPSPGRGGAARPVCLRQPTAELSFLTRSVSCRWSFRRPCFASYRKKKCAVWAMTR